MRLSALLFFLLIIAPVSESFAQPFRSIFGKDSTSWSTLVEHFDGAYTQQYSSYNKDSMIGAVRYNQVVYRYNSGEPALFLREDTITGKLWMKSYQNEEMLIMNLSLQVGDTFVAINNGSQNQFLYVANVYTDSLNRRTIQFKEKHRHTGLTNGMNTADSCILFIEGVGPTTGIANDALSTIRNELLCVYKDGVRTFANDYYKGICYIQYGATPEIFTDFTPTIYPMPCREMIQLQQIDDGVNQAVFYNLEGQIVLNLTIDSFSKSINTSSLTPGVYYLSLSTNSSLKYKPIKIVKL